MERSYGHHLWMDAREVEEDDDVMLDNIVVFYVLRSAVGVGRRGRGASASRLQEVQPTNYLCLPLF